MCFAPRNQRLPKPKASPELTAQRKARAKKFRIAIDLAVEAGPEPKALRCLLSRIRKPNPWKEARLRTNFGTMTASQTQDWLRRWRRSHERVLRQEVVELKHNIVVDESLFRLNQQLLRLQPTLTIAA